jgi:hypothetical protein
MLALEPGRTVSADRLAEGLWGDELPPSAAKMVQLYVSHLRRVLDGDGVRIVTHGRGYELQLPERDVDAVRFERLVGESRPREGLALWHGDALADLTDEPFAAAEIRRLEELRVRAAECAVDADLEAGRHAEVVGELDALVAAYPLREHLHADTGMAQWGADYLAAANFIQPNFECAAAQNLSRLCDAKLDRRMDRALRAPQAEAATWAAADRRVVDLAAAVPLTNRRSVVLVSERAGNVKNHFLFFTLLDQMWVR